MRLLSVGLVAGGPDSAGYFEARHRLAERALGDGATVEFATVSPSLFPRSETPATLAASELGDALAALGVAHAILELVGAAHSGENAVAYDAVCIGVLQDVGLTLARTLSPVPVVSYGQAAMAVASCVSSRVGLVVFNKALLPLAIARLSAHRADPIVAAQALDLPYATVLAAFEERSPEREQLLDALRSALGDLHRRGAEVAIAGEMPLSVLAAELDLSRGADIPMIDGLSAMLLEAATLVALEQSSGLWSSRKRASDPPIPHAAVEVLLTLGRLGAGMTGPAAGEVMSR